jgi:hypothetical protein
MEGIQQTWQSRAVVLHLLEEGRKLSDWSAKGVISPAIKFATCEASRRKLVSLARPKLHDHPICMATFRSCPAVRRDGAGSTYR